MSKQTYLYFWRWSLLSICLLLIGTIAISAQEQAEKGNEKEKEIKNLIQGLASSSSETINRSANELARIGKTIIPYLAEAYAKPIADRQRHYIVFAAVCLDDRDTGELMLKYLEDEQARISAYYDGLMRAETKRSKNDIFGDPNASNVRPPVLSYDVRLMAIDKLGKFRETKAVPILLKTIRMPSPSNSLLKSKELSVRQRITRILSRFVDVPEPNPQIVGAVMELLDDKDKDTVRWALYSLKTSRFQAPLEQLQKLLAGYDKGVAEYAFSALAIYKDEKASGILKKYQNNSNPYVKSCAQAAWREVSGEQPVVSPTMTSEELTATKEFFYPIREYLKDSNRESFKTEIDAKIIRQDMSSFANKTHLGDDCGWYQDGAPVYAIADGLVRLVTSKPSITDADNNKLWGWGGLIIIEHKITEKVQSGKETKIENKSICSLYGHLAKDVSVKEGEAVRKGQRIGAIGMGFSRENGDYEAHLHFGLHEGAYGAETGQYAPWITGYNPKDEEIVGWIDPLKFLKSKVR